MAASVAATLGVRHAIIGMRTTPFRFLGVPGMRTHGPTADLRGYRGQAIAQPPKRPTAAYARRHPYRGIRM